MIKLSSKMITLFAIALFTFSLLITPASVPLKGESDNSASRRTPFGSSVTSDYPDNYTRVEWDQGTMNEQWVDSWNRSHYEFGPTVTYQTRNATTNALIVWNETIDLNGWVNLIMKVPKTALSYEIPFAVLFQATYYNFSVLGPEGRITQAGTTPITGMGMYFVNESRWDYYSTTNMTFMEEPPADLPVGTTIEDVFGPPVDPFMELDIAGCSAAAGADYYWATFKFRFNQSAQTGFYHIMAMAMDSSLQPIAQSQTDEFGGRIFGAAFDDLVHQAVGGYYSWTRLGDDGNILLSATRGDDFNQTATITNGTTLANVTFYIDVPSQVLTTQWVYGPYTEVEQSTGGWQYDTTSETYIWNATVPVTRTLQFDGLHPETYYTGIDLSVEYQFWDGFQFQHDWAWPRQAVTYHFHNDSFTVNLAYDFRSFEWMDDSKGGYWYETWTTQYFPWPGTDIPLTYILNASTSSHYQVGQNHVVNFRGHISEDVLPTGGEFSMGPLHIRDRVTNIDGKDLAPAAYLPISSEEEKAASEMLRQLGVESPTAVVRLVQKGQPYHPSWMFQSDVGETFTVQSLLQGGADLASDIDGVGLFLRAWDEKWGWDMGEDWQQHSEIEVQIRVDDTGAFDVKVFNYTRRTSWGTGLHYEWMYVEVIPGVWEWREVEIVGDYWQELIWDHKLGDWTNEWFPFHDSKSVMSVDYFDVGNLTYGLIGNDLRIVFDVTPRAGIPGLEWNWDFFYGNLTWVTDYEAGEDFHLVTGWIEDTVYSYTNGTDTLHITSPQHDVVYRNNDTGELYMQESFPFIVINGTEYEVEKYYVDMGSTLEERVVFERWDPEGWDEQSQSYSGSWKHWYQLPNGTEIDIHLGTSAMIFNITLDDGRWFLAPEEFPRYNPFLNEEFFIMLNGTQIVVRNETGQIYFYTPVPLSSTPVKFDDTYVLYANGRMPIYLAVEPFWEVDHYVIYLNSTFERIDVWWDDFMGRYFYWNTTDFMQYWFDGMHWSRVFEGKWMGGDFLMDELGYGVRYKAFTKMHGDVYPLPVPGMDVWDIFDLNFVTPKKHFVYIDGAPYEVIDYPDGWDNILGYSYRQFKANVTGTLYNLTEYSWNPFTPWSPMSDMDRPFTAIANGSIGVPEIFHNDWTVALGHTDPDTRRFVVDQWLELKSGLYQSPDGPDRIFNNDLPYPYVVTKSDEMLNYTQHARAFFFNITLENGTSFYSLDPWFNVYETWNDTSQYWEVHYYYFMDLNGSEIRFYDLPEFTFTQANSTIVDDIFNPAFYWVDGKWYDIFMVEWHPFFTLVAANGTSWEVVDLMNDWEHRFNIPSFNYTLDGGTTWYNVTGSRDMIYQAFWTHGWSQKLDYQPLPVTVMREQWSIVIGIPRYGMWDLDSWTIDEATGALDLDGNLETTNDQFYVRSSYESTHTYNVTQEYLWVNIMWEPDSGLWQDEFHLNSFTGVVTTNWSYTWADNYYWYHADTGDQVTNAEMTVIQDLILDPMGHPAPGYWGISWMAQNFTSDLLKTQAEAEGWEWFDTSQEWSWIWWELQEGYSTEVNNGTHTVPMDINLAYQYAGMMAWNDTDTDSFLDIDIASLGSAELTHYWMPANVESVNFTTPGEAWGNTNTTDMEYRAVNETIDFGVAFYNVSGEVFPFGEWSYWDWYDGQYIDSDFSSFTERPSIAEVDQFSIDVHFTGYVNATGANYADVKFDMLVGDWFVDTPGGRDVLEGFSLAVAFYSDLTIVTPEGTEIPAMYTDDLGQPLHNNQTAPSSNYTMGTGLSSVALMSMGGSSYSWAKNASLAATVSAQTVPLSTFSTMYVSDAGGSATAFNVTSSQFYTVISFDHWAGYQVEVDPVFVSYISRGADDATPPTIEGWTESSVDILGTENLRIEIDALDEGGSEIFEVVVMDLDNTVNYTATWDEGAGVYFVLVPRSVDGRYNFNYRIVVADGAGNQVTTDDSYTFRDNIDPTITSVDVSNNTDGLGREIAEISAMVSDTGGSGIFSVTLTYSNTSGNYDVAMVDSGATYDGVIPNHAPDSFVDYWVTVEDGDGNSVQSSTDTFHFAAGPGPDTLGPSITSVNENPASPTSSDSVTVSATVQDGSGVNTVTLQYKVDSGSWNNVSMSASGNTYTGVIPAQAADSLITYRIVATDMVGNEAISGENSYTVASGTTTTTTTEPTAPPPPPPPPGLDDTMVMMIVGGMFLVVFLIIGALVARRRK
ncbi:MAG: hypothetical protein ACXADD_14100 [Candidatus Thorarchaeota archaeon]|jgi:hypothetical protein